MCARTAGAPASPAVDAVTTSAAMLRITVHVDESRSARPATQCATGMDDDLHVHVGDTVVYEANFTPRLTSADARVVRVAITPLPSVPDENGIGPGHVLVALTAIGPGTVSFTFTDCGGTGC